jgi:hypothetical protein
MISDDAPYPLKDLVEAIAEACHVAPPQSSIPRSMAMTTARVFEYLWRLQLMQPVLPFLPANVARWNAHYPCSIAKARAQVGYEPRYRLVDGVRRTVQWYRENGYLCHSLPWVDGVLDLEVLAGPSNIRQAHASQLAWNVVALTWRLPSKLARRIGRHMRRSKT